VNGRMSFRTLLFCGLFEWYPLHTGVTLVALTAFMFTLPSDGKIGPGVLAGLFGRLLLVSYLGWLISVVESPHLQNRNDVALFRLLNRSVLRRVLGQS
jgi:hypothetical protein